MGSAQGCWQRGLSLVRGRDGDIRQAPDLPVTWFLHLLVNNWAAATLRDHLVPRPWVGWRCQRSPKARGQQGPEGQPAMGRDPGFPPCCVGKVCGVPGSGQALGQENLGVGSGRGVTSSNFRFSTCEARLLAPTALGCGENVRKSCRERARHTLVA